MAGVVSVHKGHLGKGMEDFCGAQGASEGKSAGKCVPARLWEGAMQRDVV